MEIDKIINVLLDHYKKKAPSITIEDSGDKVPHRHMNEINSWTVSSDHAPQYYLEIYRYPDRLTLAHNLGEEISLSEYPVLNEEQFFDSLDSKITRLVS